MHACWKIHYVRENWTFFHTLVPCRAGAHGGGGKAEKCCKGRLESGKLGEGGPYNEIMFSNSIENGQIESDAILNHFPGPKSRTLRTGSIFTVVVRVCQRDSHAGHGAARSVFWYFSLTMKLSKTCVFVGKFGRRHVYMRVVWKAGV